MGTPDFSVPALRSIAALHDVCAAYTQPDRPSGRGQKVTISPVKKAALELGVPVHQPARLRDAKELQTFLSYRPDLAVVAAYGQILRQDWLDGPRLGCVNIHASLLPRWRGAAPIQWAIASGDQRTGVSIMKMVLGLDAGPVCLTDECKIEANETGGSLHDQLAGMSGHLIVQALKMIASGQVVWTPQDDRQVTYASKLTKDMQWLDPKKTAQELERLVRAFDPWPGTSIHVRELGRLKVLKARVVKDAHPENSCLWSPKDSGRLILSCFQSSLELLEVQMEGRKPMKTEQFLNGLKTPMQVQEHLWKVEDVNA